tara:strand:- start:311 stop:628 length:318 start_codon:yes stop_codon:yes gene_type:complete
MNYWSNDNYGSIDGFTYFSWEHRNQDMLKKLYPVGEEYFKPKVGSLLIFPNWLKHAVMPFYGHGERRIISANANVIPPEMFDWRNKSDEERQQVIKDLRSVKTKR